MRRTSSPLLTIFDDLIEEGNALRIQGKILFTADLAETVKGARQCQRLEGLAIDGTEIHVRDLPGFAEKVENKW